MSDRFSFPKTCKYNIEKCIVCGKQTKHYEQGFNLLDYKLTVNGNGLRVYVCIVHKTVRAANDNQLFNHPWMFDVIITFAPTSISKALKLVFHIMNGRVGYLFVPYMASHFVCSHDIKKIGYELMIKHELEKFFRFLTPLVIFDTVSFFKLNAIKADLLNIYLPSMLDDICANAIVRIKNNIQPSFKQRKLIQQELDAIDNYIGELITFAKTAPTYEEIHSFLKQVQIEPSFKYIAHYGYQVYDTTVSKWQETISTCFGNIHLKNEW